MKISADATALKAALTRAAKVISARSHLPILAMVKVSAGDRIAITATDLDAWIAIDVDGDVLTPGEACIPAAELTRLVALAKKGRVEISVEQDVAHIAFGRSSADLNTLPVDDFPPGEFAEDLPLVDGALLAAAIQFCLPAVSTEETRYYLNGVRLESASGTAIAVATDGHRIHYAEMPGAAIEADAILPTTAAQMVAELAATGEIGFRATPQGWAAEAGNCRMKGRVIDGAFPDWRRILSAADLVATLSAADMTHAAEVALVGTTERTRALVIEALDGQVIVTGGSTGGNIARPGSHSLDAETHREMRQGINGRYLAATLAACGDEVALLAWGDGMDFAPAEQRGDLQLHARIMGMRI